jgi:hypothetical protein
MRPLSPRVRRYLEEPGWSSVPLVNPLLGRRSTKALTELSVLGYLARRQVDLPHSLPMTAPLFTRAANVVTVTDVTWIVAAAQAVGAHGPLVASDSPTGGPPGRPPGRLLRVCFDQTRGVGCRSWRPCVAASRLCYDSLRVSDLARAPSTSCSTIGSSPRDWSSSGTSAGRRLRGRPPPATPGAATKERGQGAVLSTSIPTCSP